MFSRICYDIEPIVFSGLASSLFFPTFSKVAEDNIISKPCKDRTPAVPGLGET